MTVQEIIKTYKLQSTPLNVAGEQGNYDAWWKAAKTPIKREHIIKVLKAKKHMDSIIEGNLDAWYALNSWSDLVSMMDSCLEIESESFLNTLV